MKRKIMLILLIILIIIMRFYLHIGFSSVFLVGTFLFKVLIKPKRAFAVFLLIFVLCIISILYFLNFSGYLENFSQFLFFYILMVIFYVFARAEKPKKFDNDKHKRMCYRRDQINLLMKNLVLRVYSFLPDTVSFLILFLFLMIILSISFFLNLERIVVLFSNIMPWIMLLIISYSLFRSILFDFIKSLELKSYKQKEGVIDLRKSGV